MLSWAPSARTALPAAFPLDHRGPREYSSPKRARHKPTESLDAYDYYLRVTATYILGRSDAPARGGRAVRSPLTAALA